MCSLYVALVHWIARGIALWITVLQGELCDELRSENAEKAPVFVRNDIDNGPPVPGCWTWPNSQFIIGWEHPAGLGVRVLVQEGHCLLQRAGERT